MHDGRVFDYTGDAERMAAEVRKFSPGDVDGYAPLRRRVAEDLRGRLRELGDVPFSRARDMLKIVPKMIRLRSHLSVWRLVCKYIKDDALRVVMSFHPLLVGGNPFTTTSIYTLIAYLERKWGVWFAKGGTGAIVQALVDLFVSLGGALELGAAAEEILVENGRVTGVRLAGGRTLPATIVVSNGDAPATYKRLLPASARRKHTDEKIDRMRYSMSLFVSYFGTKKQYPDMAHHTILLGPRYRELLDDIFDRKVLAPDFSLYLHAPTRTDPVARSARLRELLRALAGAAPRIGRRLVGARRRLSAKRYSNIWNITGFPDCARTW